MLSLAFACLFQAPAPAPAEDLAALEARAVRGYARLAEKEQKELLEYLDLELEQQHLFQRELVRFVLAQAGKAPEDFAPEKDPAWFDPAVHAPEQPIARKPLAPDDPRLATAREELLPALAAGEPRRAFRYDYGQRQVLRARSAADRARILANALRGCVPGFDLAEALVERELDDGAEEKALAAFGHAYTDRSGNVYTGITLFDAWSSGSEIEMPDVDTLGILHEVKNEWTRYRAPVSAQEPLYRELGEIFRPASRHRALRHAFAATFLCGAPELGSYAGLRENLHLAWEKARSTPSELAHTLPPSARWKEFVDALVEEGRAHPELWKAAELRRDTLVSDTRAVRATALAALEAFGALGKLESGPAKEH